MEVDTDLMRGVVVSGAVRWESLWQGVGRYTYEIVLLALRVLGYLWGADGVGDSLNRCDGRARRGRFFHDDNGRSADCRGSRRWQVGRSSLVRSRLGHRVSLCRSCNGRGGLCCFD